MAKDGNGVLHAVDIQEAHVFGVSMGGLITQHMAVNHPDCVLSFALIMSSGNIDDPNLPSISTNIAQELIKAGHKYGLVKTERNTSKLHIA